MKVKEKNIRKLKNRSFSVHVRTQIVKSNTVTASKIEPSVTKIVNAPTVTTINLFKIIG